MKMLWKGIKYIISSKPNNTDTFSHLVDDNALNIFDSVHIANEFNEYFTKVAERITKRIPRTQKLPCLTYRIQTLIIFPSLHLQLTKYPM